MNIFDYFKRFFNVRVILEGVGDGKNDSFYVDVSDFRIPNNTIALKINGNSLKYVGILDDSGKFRSEKKEAGEVLQLEYVNGLSDVHILISEDNRVYYDVRRGIKVREDQRLWGFLSRMVEACGGKYDFNSLFNSYSGKA